MKCPTCEVTGDEISLLIPTRIVA